MGRWISLTWTRRKASETVRIGPLAPPARAFGSFRRSAKSVLDKSTVGRRDAFGRAFDDLHAALDDAAVRARLDGMLADATQRIPSAGAARAFIAATSPDVR